MLHNYIARYMFDDEKSGFLTSIRDAIRHLYQGGDADSKASIDVVFDLSLKLIINPRQEFVHAIEFDAPYDIAAWMEDGYIQPLSAYALPKAKTFTLASRNPKTVSAALKRDKDNKRSDCFTFFRYMNSSLMRRYVANPGEMTLAQPVPHEPWKREFRVGGGLA